MGGRLFPALLQTLQEPYEDRPLLDKLNRLEQLGFLSSAESWQNIRATRNRFAHEYPDDWEKNAVLVNLASSAARDMDGILNDIQTRLRALGQTQLLPIS